jgi:ElaB/YqjD/DUF883 family membrane-anchored ribosome-binding protein
MGLADRFSQLTKRAKDAAAEHKDQVDEALRKAAAAADQQTGGKYHDKIVKAEGKAEDYVENLPEPGAAQTAPASGPGTEPATAPGTEPHAPGGPAS